MSERITIKTIALQGFRAFLRLQTFEFNEGKSLAVFAPNAKGKSSLIDAVEFFLSEEGTLTRLGKIKGGTKAGREALQHAEATAKNITGEVTLTFHDGTASFSDTRRVVSQDYARPASAARVEAATRVPILIRGYELRRFVEEQTPEERYEEIAGWFSLSRLVNIQSAIKDTRSAMKKKVDDNSIVTERTRDLMRITDRAFTAWNEPQVLAWLNDNFLHMLDASLSLATLSTEDPAVGVLRARKAEEEKRVGLDTLKEVIALIKRVYLAPAGADASGTIVSFEKSYQALVTAHKTEAAEKTKAEKAIFKDIWEAAERVLNDKTITISSCPVCSTELSKTPARSREALSTELSVHLGHIRTYREASQTLDKAKKALDNDWNTLKAAMENLQALLKVVDHAPDAGAVANYAQSVAEMSKTKVMPDSSPIKTTLLTALTVIQNKHDALAQAQGKCTYGKALAKFDELAIVKSAMDRAALKKTELERLSHSLYLAGSSIDASIHAYIETIIAALRNDTNTLYRAIQGNTVDCPIVRLELPPASETNQRRLSLMIDYLGRMGVAASGYLSDSQMHTLALALRLAAIKRLNKTIAVIALDDIVTSYDADHRRYIAAAIASELKDFQLILVTHDDRFFKHLKDVLPRSSWQFRCIKSLEPDFGPRFADHKTMDQEIEDAWREGNLASNLIRHAEEEWLTRICIEFGVHGRIKKFGEGHERWESAQALAQFFKAKCIKVPTIPGVANPFLVSLAAGVIENFGSHFQDNAYAAASVGDEKCRWAEFKQFRDLFKCPSCFKNRFERLRSWPMPRCRHCQTPFTFSSPMIPGPQGTGARN